MQDMLNWFQDRKNLPYIAIGAVVLIGAVVAVMFISKGGAPEGAATTPAPAASSMPMPGTPPQAAPAPAPAPAAAAPAAPAAAGPTAVAAAPGTGPLLPYRKDPFKPIGRPPTRTDALRKLGDMAIRPRLAPIGLTKLDLKGPAETAALGPQPSRRLAAVMWNGRVSAILETNGVADVVKPGMTISRGNSRVRVESIEPGAITLATLDTRKPILIRVALAAAPPSATPQAQITPGMGNVPGGTGPQGGSSSNMMLNALQRMQQKDY